MRIHWHLLTWMFRPLQGMTLVCSASAAFYVLSFHSVLNFPGDSMAILFVVAHSFLISRLLGSVRSESFAFLYSRGLSRDQLLLHLWLASSLSVLATWLPCAVLVLTPLRATFQDWLETPWFPLMASTEWPFVTDSLLCYVTLLPVFHYEWIRSAAPYRDSISGHLLSFALLTSVMILGARLLPIEHFYWRWCFLAGFAAVSTILGLIGRWVHQRIEVQS